MSVPGKVLGLVMVDSVTSSYRQRDGANDSILRMFVREHLRPLLILQETVDRILFPIDSASTSLNGYSEYQKSVLIDPGFRSRMISSSNAEGASQDDLSYMTDIGGIPLVVIEAGMVRWPMDEIEWRNGQRELLSKSDRSSHIVADLVGHSIPRDAPEYIVDAIQVILQQTSFESN